MVSKNITGGLNRFYVATTFTFALSSTVVYKKKGQRKIQGVPQSHA